MPHAPASQKVSALNALKALPLLSGLEPAVVQEIARHTQFVRYSPGQVVFQQNESTNTFVIVLAGKAQVVSLSDDGRPIGTQVLNPGDFIGELSVIDALPRNETLVASQDTVIAHLNASIAKQLFLQYPMITDRILQQLCRTVRQVAQIRSVLAINRAQSRVYHLLLQFAKPAADNSLTIERLPNQQTIAMMANVSRESVSRAIHALIRQNLLRKEARRLIITNPATLTKLAQGEVEPHEATHSP
jgi:CRP/FNR family cyclic AMP-dependent transcriptional regulator